MRFYIQATLLCTFMVLRMVDLSLTEVSRLESQNKLPLLLQKYLAELKLRMQNSENVDNNLQTRFDALKRGDDSPIYLPDGMPPKLATGPGNPPRSMLHLSGKRSDHKESEYDMTCKEHEWFVFIDDMPACVNPIWEGGYDPTYCAKMKSGWVYCGCEEDQVPGMIEGLDTCVDQDELANGHCKINPCPNSFKCEDNIKERRFDCMKENIKIPTWY